MSSEHDVCVTKNSFILVHNEAFFWLDTEYKVLLF